MEVLQNRRFYGKMECLSLWWAKYVGLKQGAIGNTLGEQIGNLIGTHWELEKSMLGTNGKNGNNPVGSQCIQ
jgi:hypothetical protein